MSDDRELNIHTLAVQGGHDQPSAGGTPAVPSLSPAVGFIYPTMQETEQAFGSDGMNFVYGRQGNPTHAALEQVIATLEGAESAASFSSGMAALHAAILALVPPGGVILAAHQLYGNTRTLLEWLSSSMGISVEYANFLDLEEVEQSLSAFRPTLVLCETLTNPLVRVVRIDKVAELTHQMESTLIVDNTFATPFVIRPIEHGVDLVIHSTTKYINGHGDVIGGVIAGNESLIRVARSYRKLLGAIPGTFESWLTLRGIRTMAVRVKQSCLSARQVSAWLEDQPQLSQVYYPGLESDTQANTDARSIFRRNYFGGMLAFEIKDATRADAYRFVDSLKIIHPVTSLGDVNSLISHPATASHRGLSAEQRQALGISEGTLRVSVGIEDPNDLITDLRQALVKLKYG